MKVTVEHTPDSEAVLNVELDWDEVEKASERAYRKIAKQYNVPGFRKGKAPRSMLERMLGKDAIYQEGIEDLIDESYRQAIREHDLKPIAQPSVEASPIEYGQPYTFTARVPVLTPVELGDYQAIRVEVPDITVTDDEIDAVVERIQQDQAVKIPVERPAQLGDFVTVDLKLEANDKVISNLHDNEFELVIERPGIFAGMDDEIIGMSEGETKEFTATIPEDYTNPDLAGKEAHYTVTLKGVKVNELPEVDGELAKSAGAFENIEQLREAIQHQLRTQKETEARRELRDNAVNQAIEGSQVQVHPALVDDEVHTMMRETERMLEQSRLNLQQYLSIMRKSEEEYHKELEPDALQRVKRDLVLNAIADAEGIEATDEEIEGWLAALTALGGKPMRLRQLSPTQRTNASARIRRDKALARLVDIATEGKGEPGSSASAEQVEANAIAATAAGAEAEEQSEATGAAQTVAPQGAGTTTEATRATQAPTSGAATERSVDRTEVPESNA